MPLNRELLASVKLESVSDWDWVEDPHDRTNDGRSGVGAGEAPRRTPAPVSAGDGDVQNDATKNVIRCLKLALERGITSISLPEKQRPLNPKTDFSIASTMRFWTAPSGAGIACCGAGAGRVREPRYQRHMRDARVSGSGDGRWQARSSRPDGVSLFGRREATTSSDDGDERDTAAFGATLRDRDGGTTRTRRSHRSTGRTQVLADFSTDDDEDDEDDEDAPPVDFTFTDFSPMCYRHIREFFHVDAKAYCDVLRNSRWHSIPTPGKSAAQLFFCGRDWVIKTMTDQESDFLRGILHRYYYHVRDNPYTLLPHFVGHHRLRIGTTTHNFIIMQNVFATTNTIHEKFDLKGSTIGRFASDAEKRRTTCTQKDLDINSPLHVGTERRLLLIDQIKKDCEFLKRSQIMDYSFLVGIHALPTTADTASAPNPSGSPGMLARSVTDGTLRMSTTLGYVAPGERQDFSGGDVTDFSRSGAGLDGRCFTAEQGGMMSNRVPGLRREIYYIGIIDILQEYDARKTLENVVFGAMYDRKRISCVDPNDYAARFIAFMSSIIV
ncbi:phosphatidylinositol 4-phosphate 5-kinase alpha [Novymonas esmeraldas]|uniref:Phosphatidylinositol 4-phosphate 5-kinase alpha n=1 Tax=Novymonas esmeraldas TaxID=1808958 RepID=A0AAW0ES95_9TRYP